MPPRTKKKGLEPSSDLPGLFPTYDGSYGINTLISVDVESKKGHKSNKGIAKAQSDDQKWVKALKGKVGRKYGMNSNLKKAIDESHKEVEEEEDDDDDEGQNPVPDNSSQPQSENQPPSSGSSSSSSASISSGPSGLSGPSGPTLGTNSLFGGGPGGPGGVGKPSEPPDDSSFIPRLMPHVPNYNRNNLPFKEESEGRHRPPYTRASLPSDNPHAHIGVNQPISPPSEHIPFYGMPQGAGSNGPISPIRPNTSRSFTFENGLFANATLQTPGQNANILGRPPTMARGPVPSGQNQKAGQFGFGGFGAAGQPTSRPTPNTQPNLQGRSMPVQPTTQPTPSVQPTLHRQPIPTPSTSGEQSSTGCSSPSVEESTLDMQPNLQGQPTPGWQPPASGQPTPGMQAGPQKQHTSGWQSGLNSPPDSNQLLLPRNATTVPKVGMAKQGPSNRRGPSGPKTPQVGKKPTTQRSSPNNKRVADQQPWTWWSSDSVLRLIVIFVIFTSALWFVLPTPPDELDDIGRTGSRLPSFSIGTVWEKISNLLPEIPDIHPISYDNTYNGPSGPVNPDNGGVESDELLAGLKNWIPESIWVQGDKSGKLKIPEDFWHALRELIMKDDSILSLKNSNISENHWLAIKSRIQRAGLGVGASLKDMEVLVQKRMSQSWDSWLRQNDKALKKASTGTALKKTDFIKLAQEEIASYNREISQEFTKLQERIKDITQQMSQLQDEVSSAGSISKDEITEIFNALVSKAVTNAKTGAVAQAVIKGYTHDMLVNQVNFFAIGAGASIDPELSSRPWKVPKDFFKSTKWLDKSGYKAQPRMAALSPWNQEGECFCAGPDLKGYGKGTNNISVITSRNIIPQHLVVEHILPGATLDPGAMPKEIEVWAYIEEVELRNEAQVFSETQFPGTPKEEALNEGYVKIGHFTYEKKDDGDGVQVFKMSDDLKNMKAITDQVIIRAINNYGADHTCFYRLMLYGEVVERPGDPPAHDNKRSWF
ncbi:hypothetical protein F4782DRAFT_490664 [Xylaria castorea]|nr:hypothetical protein F4782DRAFT_490664 [Xylaria castorea]